MTVSTTQLPTFTELLVAEKVTATWVAEAAGLSSSVTLSLKAADKGLRMSASFRPESARAIAGVFGLDPKQIAWSLSIAEIGKAPGRDSAHTASKPKSWGETCLTHFLPKSLMTGRCDNCD